MKKFICTLLAVPAKNMAQRDDAFITYLPVQTYDFESHSRRDPIVHGTEATTELSDAVNVTNSIQKKVLSRDHGVWVTANKERWDIIQFFVLVE